MGLFEPANEGRTPFDPGTYVATLVKLEATEHKEFGPGIRWRLVLSPDLSDPDEVVVQADGETPAELFAATSKAMGPAANARKYAEALLGRPLEPEELLEPEQLIGKRMTVQIVDNKGKDGKIYSKVAGVNPYRGAPKPVRTRTRTKVEDTEESEDGLPF